MIYDRMTQFADNFKQAASLMERGEKSSANSYVSAGIMAGDRADISDKRIRVFLIDHPPFYKFFTGRMMS
jgi:hypothetical protein